MLKVGTKNKDESEVQLPDKHHWSFQLSKSNDFIDYHSSLKSSQPFWIAYYRTLIKTEILNRDVLPYLDTALSLAQLVTKIPIQEIVLTEDEKKIIEKILNGHVAIRLQKQDKQCLLVNVANAEFRTVGPPQKEPSVLGPQVGFVEELDTNVNLIRKRLPVPELCSTEITVGDLSKTKVAILYMDGTANTELVNEITERVSNIKYDHISDSSYIESMISDHTATIFPLTIISERCDRVVGGLSEGKIILVVDGSPDVIILPVTLIESFISMEDYSYPWIIASVYRFLRFFTFYLAIFITPLYVAIITYHYELIPSRLLGTLASSRFTVPFPPFLEVLLLEIIIELIKEAGAHLPFRVAQTLGIVGGIVIGQAIVEAGLTSNILVILVCFSTLSNYITPIYKTGNSVRFIKFPLLLLAQFLGLFGVYIGFLFTLVHVISLSSFGSPFAGLYPLRKTSFQDLWFRLPFSRQQQNPQNLKPEKKKKSTRNITYPKKITDFNE
jgi:spore germination protein KA